MSGTPAHSRHPITVAHPQQRAPEPRDGAAQPQQPPQRRQPQAPLTEHAPVQLNTCGCGELRAPSACGPFLRCSGWRPPPAPEDARDDAAPRPAPGAAEWKGGAGGGDAPFGWWTGSALFVVKGASGGGGGGGRHGEAGAGGAPPRLRWWDGGGGGGGGGGAAAPAGPAGRGGAEEVEGERLDEWGGWVFWRFWLEVPVARRERRVCYAVDGGGGRGEGGRECAFFVAGAPRGGRADQPWRWNFYSCAGFANDMSPEDHEKLGGFQLLWQDVADRHKERPFHVMVGGGDQLYCDDVFTTPSLTRWLGIPSKEERYSAAYEDDMRDETEAGYFHHYAAHWAPITIHALLIFFLNLSFFTKPHLYQTPQTEAYYFHHYAVHWAHPAVAGVFSSIPQIMTWDDHDLFDGWGSYPERVQTCPVFQGIYAAARRFYLLFQQHTTAALARSHGLFGGHGYSQLVMLGPRVAVALPDQRAERTTQQRGRGYSQLVMLGPRAAVALPGQRAERTTQQIIGIDTYFELFMRLYQLPASVRHLAVVTTVPLVYPHLTTSQRVLEFFRKLSNVPFIFRTLKATGVTHQVYSHFDEPELLDDLKDHWSSPNHKGERRFLIENLQLMARGRQWRVTFLSGDVHLAAAGRLYSFPKSKSLVNDPCYMPQFVSSAIVNGPPPDLLVKALIMIGRPGFTNKRTKNKMVKMFPDHHRRKRLLNCRNWAIVEGVGGDPFFEGGGGAAGGGGGTSAGGGESKAEALERRGSGSVVGGSGGDRGGGRREERGGGGGSEVEARRRRRDDRVYEEGRAGDGWLPRGAEGPLGGAGGPAPRRDEGHGSAFASALLEGPRGTSRASGGGGRGGSGGMLPGSLVVTFRIQDDNKPPAQGRMNLAVPPLLRPEQRSLW
ncbi:MAG: hypothetical protein J3K34DRAFT_524717 [Monoraphidium minutum]|nr:MAG: hypothetical protein J3K34DRAFT_524717 [Monoraphidium minutum]